MAKSTVSLPAPLENIQRRWGKGKQKTGEVEREALAAEEVLEAFIKMDEYYRSRIDRLDERIIEISDKLAKVPTVWTGDTSKNE